MKCIAYLPPFKKQLYITCIASEAFTQSMVITMRLTSHCTDLKIKYSKLVKCENFKGILNWNQKRKQQL